MESRTPYLETIGERVNKILREIKERKIKVKEAYQKLTQIITEVGTKYKGGGKNSQIEN